MCEEVDLLDALISSNDLEEMRGKRWLELILVLLGLCPFVDDASMRKRVCLKPSPSWKAVDVE